MVMVRLDLAELERELGEAAADVALEVANELVNAMKRPEPEGAPMGATGRLRGSIQIFRTGDGVVWLGTRVPYAKGVWKGKPPHSPDFDAIEVWARRKLNDESAAWPVYRKIQAEGTEPNDFIGRAIDHTLDRVGQFRLSDF